MSYRLYGGEILLKDLWDPYQLSAIFMLPVFFLKDIISLLGIATPDIILLNRIVGGTIHITVSFFVYIIFKKYISKKYSYIGFLTYLLILPKQTLIIDHSNLMNWFSTIMILLLFLYIKSNKLSYLVCSSVFLALTVLSYPTQAVLLLFINVFLVTHKNKSAAIVYTGICCVLGMLFVFYLGFNIGFENILYNVQMILREGSHQTDTINRVTQTTLSFIIIMAFNLLFACVMAKLTIVLTKKKHNYIYIYAYIVMFWSISIIGYFIIGRVWPPLAMYRRYLIFSLIGFMLIYKKSNYNNEKELTIFAIPICMAIICLFTSNQGIDSASGILGLSVSFVFVKNLDIYDFESNFASIEIFLKKIVILFFIVSQCTLMALSARVSKTPGYSIFKLVKSETNALHYTYTTPENNKLFIEMESLENELHNKNVLYIGRDSIFYLLTNSCVDAPLTISTPFYDQQWVEYYERKENPDYIVIHKNEFETIEKFDRNVLGHYLLMDNYIKIQESENLIVLLKN